MCISGAFFAFFICMFFSAHVLLAHFSHIYIWFPYIWSHFCILFGSNLRIFVIFVLIFSRFCTFLCIFSKGARFFFLHFYTPRCWKIPLEDTSFTTGGNRERTKNFEIFRLYYIQSRKVVYGTFAVCTINFFFHLRRLKCCHCKYIYCICRSLQLLVNFHRLFGPGCPILFWFSKFW